MRKFIRIIACLAALALLLGGCADKSADASTGTAGTAGNMNGAAAITDTAAETKRTVTDMAGRDVTIPARIDKVYSTGQPGVVMMYTLCPEKLLGWCLPLSDEEKQYISPKYLALPVLGNMQSSNSTANKEEIMGREPDIIILMTMIDEEAVETADEIQFSMDIPVVILDYNLKSLDESYEFLGNILDEQDRAQTLAEYCRNTYEEAETIAKGIPEDEILTVYYAQGTKGLQTAPAGSSHTEVIELVGGRNAVALEADSDGRLAVNMEQVLVWNPDVIIASYSMGHTGNKVGDTGVFSFIDDGSETWNMVSAVQEGLVFDTPCYPYNWLDMPPSVNRVIGIKWMGNLLYPNYYKYDIRTETKEFYSLFYDKILTDEQLDILLNHAVREVG